MKRTTALLSLLTLTASGCFDPGEVPPAVEAETDGGSSSGSTTDASGGSPTSEVGSSSGTTAPPSTTAVDTDSTSTSDAETTDTDPDTGDETDADDSTGEAELGPRLEMSTPSDGDLDAGLDGYFLLHFDRPISQNDALGHIFVTQSGGEPILVAPQPCPPDADPQCVAEIGRAHV